MKLTNRLDFRHIAVIVLLVVLLYWLLLSSGKKEATGHHHHTHLPSKNDKLLNTEGKKAQLHVMPPTQNSEVEKLKNEIAMLKEYKTSQDEESKKQIEHHKQEMEKMSSKIQQQSEDSSTLEKENENLKTLKKQKDKEIKMMKEEIAEKDEKVVAQRVTLKALDLQINNISAASDETDKKNQELMKNIIVKTVPFDGLKLVHLDLKGAPPKIDYLISFLKLSKQLGANGFLIEYEDMFPWKDDLSILARENAYSEADIEHILMTAKDEGMEVIPLIQTFGHLEFILKHKEFSHLRANKEISNSVSALNNKSIPFVRKLIDQILDLHPDSKWVHLGGDEVWNIKTCEACPSSNMSDAELFLHHIVPLLKYVKTKKTAEGAVEVKAIIWDDMMRRWPVDKLEVMKDIAIPMVWAYVANLANYHHFPKEMWVRYTQVFPEIWIASSFKGALKPWSNVVPIQQHLDNHLSWLKIIKNLVAKGVKVPGIALTGWSRFDHYGPLCELLPAGIPCLALCLSVLQKGSFTKELHEIVSNKLGFKQPFRIGITNFKGYTPEIGTFKGGDLYELVGSVEKAVGWKDWSSVREIGWSRPYQLRTEFLSFFALNTTITGLSKSIDLLHQSRKKAVAVLENYFEEEVVTEWIEDKIDYQVQLANASIKRTKDIIKKQKF